MQIFIKNIFDKIITLDVEPSDTIEKVKNIISQKEDIPTDKLQLLFLGKTLEKCHTLDYYDIKNDSTIYFCKLNQEELIDLFVKTKTGKTIVIKAYPTDYISQIKSKIEVKEGLLCSEQRIIFSGKQLQDDFKLNYYNIKNNSTLHLVLSLSGC